MYHSNAAQVVKISDTGFRIYHKIINTAEYQPWQLCIAVTGYSPS